MFINDCILGNDEVTDVSWDSDSDDKEEEDDDNIYNNIYNKMFINDCILGNDEVPDVSWDSDSDDKEEVDFKIYNILLYILKKTIIFIFHCEEDL